MKTPDEDDLHALVDGRLAPEYRAQVEAWLADQPHLRAEVNAWRQQREELRQLGMNAVDGAVPIELLRVLHQGRRRWLAPVGGAIAASVMLLAGWLGHAWFSGTGVVPERAQVRRFVHDAVVAHAVYTPEVRHPVEVGADQSAHLVQWLSKRLGAPLKVPDLRGRGYELVGGRLLPGEGGARAQFMFQDGAGSRITLYVSVLDKGTSPGTTAFRYEDGKPASAFYWIDGEFGYALTGDLPRTTLLELARLAYSQLTG